MKNQLGRLVLTTIVVLLADVHLTQSFAGDESSCWKKSGDVAIRACTTIISSRRLYGKPISNKNLATIYYNRAYYLNKQDRYKEAIADLTQAIKLNSSESKYYDLRAINYRKIGGYDKAILDSTQAIRLSPKEADYYHTRGIVYRKKADYDKAISDYNQAIRLNPDHFSAYTNRGNVYFDMGQMQKAIADYKKALEINPDYELAKSNLQLVSASTKQEEANDDDCHEKSGVAAIQVCTKIISSKRIYGKPINNKNLVNVLNSRGVEYKKKANMTKPSPIIIRQSGSTPILPSPTLTVVASMRVWAKMTRPLPTVHKLSKSNKIMPWPTTIAAIPIRKWDNGRRRSPIIKRHSKSIQTTKGQRPICEI